MDIVSPSDHESGGPADPSENPLQMLATQAKERGLEVREHCRGAELTEIAVTNPQDPRLRTGGHGMR
jgi:hypothetical protein